MLKKENIAHQVQFVLPNCYWALCPHWSVVGRPGVTLLKNTDFSLSHQQSDAESFSSRGETSCPASLLSSMQGFLSALSLVLCMLSQPVCVHKCIYPVVPGRHYFFEVIHYLWLVTIFLSLLPLRSPSLEGRGIYLGLSILIFLFFLAY